MKKYKNYIIIAFVIIVLISLLIWRNSQPTFSGNASRYLMENIEQLEGPEYSDVLKYTAKINGKTVEIYETAEFETILDGSVKRQWDADSKVMKMDKYNCVVTVKRYAKVGDKVYDMANKVITYIGYEDHETSLPAKIVEEDGKTVVYSKGEKYFNDFASQAKDACKEHMVQLEK